MRSVEELSDTKTIEEPASPYVPFGERLVVAPCDGRFVPLPADVFTADGQWVEKVPGSARSIPADGEQPSVRGSKDG